MTEEELQAIEARANAATPGPWYAIATDDEHFQSAAYVGLEKRGKLGEGLLIEETGELLGAGLYNDGGRRKKRLMPGGVDPETVIAITTLQYPRLADLENHSENALFIAYARDDVPALVSEVRRLRRIVNDLSSEVE